MASRVLELFIQLIKVHRFGGGQRRDKFCDGVVKLTRELNNAKRGCDSQNKRVYIGPGRDGSSDDEISVDVKFYPANTRINTPQSWKDAGYLKTTFGYWPPEDSPNNTELGEWLVVDNQASLDTTFTFDGGG